MNVLRLKDTQLEIIPAEDTDGRFEDDEYDEAALKLSNIIANDDADYRRMLAHFPLLSCALNHIEEVWEAFEGAAFTPIRIRGAGSSGIDIANNSKEGDLFAAVIAVIESSLVMSFIESSNPYRNKHSTAPPYNTGQEKEYKRLMRRVDHPEGNADEAFFELFEAGVLSDRCIQGTDAFVAAQLLLKVLEYLVDASGELDVDEGIYKGVCFYTDDYRGYATERDMSSAPWIYHLLLMAQDWIVKHADLCPDIEVAVSEELCRKCDMVDRYMASVPEEKTVSMLAN